MARTSTLYRFSLSLSDIDRGVYESLELRVPCHPSEDEARLVVRVLARALFAEEGLDFGRGLSTNEDAALWTHSLSGELTRWIDVGAPSAARLHRASKRAPNVHVVTTKNHATLRAEWTKSSIYGAERLELIELPGALVDELASWLGRQNTWFVTVQDDALQVSDGERSADGVMARSTLEEFLSSPQ